MKPNKQKLDKLKKDYKRGTLTLDVLGDGTVFYYETGEHKTALEDRKAAKEAAKEAKRSK